MTAEKTNQAAIKQFSITYHADQDRLLWCIESQQSSQILLWLTYRQTRAVWAMLGGAQLFPKAYQEPSQSINESVKQFKREAVAAQKLAKVNVNKAFNLPNLAQSSGIMLVKSVQYRTLKTGENFLDMECFEGKSVSIGISPEIKMALCKMMVNAAKDGQWPLAGVAMEQQSNEKSDPTFKQVLH